MDNLNELDKRMWVTADAEVGPIRVHELFRSKVNRNGNLIIAGNRGKSQIIKFDWLRAAAETYEISEDPRDYVVAEVPLVTADMPNRNFDCFPFQELSRFSNLLGIPVFKSFIGKPTFQDHKNDDPRAAKGINFDSVMVREAGPNGVPNWKVRVLAGFDRTKDKYLAEAIAKGERTGYSMGALVGRTVCSVCKGNTSHKRACHCIGAKKGNIVIVGGSRYLKYDLCSNVNFIENSSVGSPADHTAHSYERW